MVKGRESEKVWGRATLERPTLISSASLATLQAVLAADDSHSPPYYFSHFHTNVIPDID